MCNALDAELLTRLRSHGKPVSLAALFGGRAPRWASDACDRLLAGGVLFESPDGTLTVTVQKKATG